MSAVAHSSEGRYRLDSRIATGGMGEVWRSTDTLLDREVAVKVLKSEYADDPTFRDRFSSEARHAASLHHPNVASVFDVGELSVDDGSGTHRPFLVMELVPGQPLSTLLQGGVAMSPEVAADLVAQAADAIAAAHAIGVVHRDVKPGNLLVTPEGGVKITDFGIARAVDGASLTQTGQILGTPHYLSPEQAEGRSATPASDVYALGVVLYECLAGHRPFERDSAIQVALAHLRDEVPPLPDPVPERLRRIVGRALAKRPEDRFSSASELAAALRGGPLDVEQPATQLMASPPIAAPPAPARTGGVPAWWPWAAAGLAALVLVVATATLTGRGNHSVASADATAGTSSPPEATPLAASRLRVRAAVYVGKRAGTVERELSELGFEVRRRVVPATSAAQLAGTVAAVRPSGLVDAGGRITLDVWDQSVAPDPAAGDGGDGGPPAKSDTGEKKQPGNAKGKGKR